MESVKVSTKYQVVIPREARKKLDVHEGDELLVQVKDGVMIIMKRPVSYTEFTRGLGSRVWEGVDIDKYLRGERESWEQDEN